MDQAYKSFLEETDQKDTPSLRAAFKAGWEARSKEGGAHSTEVPPDLNR
jgi:hypothetical protein